MVPIQQNNHNYHDDVHVQVMNNHDNHDHHDIIGTVHVMRNVETYRLLPPTVHHNHNDDDNSSDDEEVPQLAPRVHLANSSDDDGSDDDDLPDLIERPQMDSSDEEVPQRFGRPPSSNGSYSSDDESNIRTLQGFEALLQTVHNMNIGSDSDSNSDGVRDSRGFRPVESDSEDDTEPVDVKRTTTTTTRAAATTTTTKGLGDGSGNDVKTSVATPGGTSPDVSK